MAFAFRFCTIAGLLLAITGCWTGELIESARLHERVLSYQRISLVGDELRVEYEAEVTHDLSDKREGTPKTKLRAATFSVAALAQRPVIPVDEFPLRHIRPGSRDGSPLTLGRGPSTQTYPLVGTKSSSNNMVARLSEANGRDIGFGLCPATGDACLGFFHSAALYQDRIAWWAYPVAPFSIALDIALLPIQLFTLPPLIALSD